MDKQGQPTIVRYHQGSLFERYFSDANRRVCRRTFLQSFLAWSSASLACSSGRTEAARKIEDMAKHQDLVLIGSDFAPGTESPSAFNTAGSNVGRFAKIEQPYLRSVSLDGRWVAWFPRYSFLQQGAERPIVLFMSDPCCIRNLRVRSRSVGGIAISSKGERLAVVAVDGPTSFQLVVMRPETGEVEQDLTGLVQQFTPFQIERLEISVDGRILTLGSRESFVVLDVPSMRRLLAGPGRFPSISPTGSKLAFVDNKGHLIVIDLAAGTRQDLLGALWTAYGVGAWSPDGQFVLAGVRSVLGFFIYLAAVNSSNGEVTAVKRLDEGDFGQSCAWVKSNLLSP